MLICKSRLEPSQSLIRPFSRQEVLIKALYQKRVKEKQRGRSERDGQAEVDVNFGFLITLQVALIARSARSEQATASTELGKGVEKAGQGIKQKLGGAHPADINFTARQFSAA